MNFIIMEDIQITLKFLPRFSLNIHPQMTQQAQQQPATQPQVNLPTFNVGLLQSRGSDYKPNRFF